MSAVHYLVLSQCTRVTDGQTDRRTDRLTDRITTPKTAVAYARALKRNVFNLRLKVTIVSQIRISTGIKFQVVAAECLKARDATGLGQVVASRS